MGLLTYTIILAFCLMIVAEMGYLIFGAFDVKRIRYIRGLAVRVGTEAFLTVLLLAVTVTLLFLKS